MQSFYKILQKLGEKFTKGKYDSSYPSISYSKWTRKHYYRNGELEVTKRLNVAKKLDKNAALKSASWGKFQIMGANHNLVGYSSAEEMVTFLEESEDNHVIVFGKFVMANKTMHKALKKKDWATFARLYNGSGYKVNKYDEKMEKAYNEFKK